jgi:hypothetical protein
VAAALLHRGTFGRGSPAGTKRGAEGQGDSILYDEFGEEPSADVTGTIGRIPASWRFTNERIHELLAAQDAVSIPRPQPPGVDISTLLWISPDKMPRERQAVLAVCA